MTPPTVNAYYDPSMNDINFPRAFCRRRSTIRKATDAENYGHIGAIVGHELTHGFDDQGSQFDGNGNLSDWWTADDRKKFDAMTDCEVQEYGNFTAVDDVNVNGKLTLGENTADNGGLRLAYDGVPCRRKAQRHRFECEAGRIYSADPAVFPCLWTELVRRTAARADATAGADRSALAARSSAPTAWCRICRSLARPSAAKWASP